MASPTIYPEYPPSLNREQETFLLAELKDWTIAHGLAVRPPPSFIPGSQDPSGVLATTAPVTLFPSPFPRDAFDRGLQIQTAYNELYAAVSRDEEWLEEIVKQLLDIDDFVAKLWEIHAKVKADGYVQDLSLGLFRSDYMVHMDPARSNKQPEIKQVEFNTIASSFGGLSSKVSSLHKYLLSTEAYPHSSSQIINAANLPENRSIEGLATGLAKAHQAYGTSKTQRALCVLFVVQSSERNVFDQRLIEYELNSAHKVRTFRLPFSEIQRHTTLDYSRALIYSPPYTPKTSFEVTTIYYRAGYDPSDYPDAEAWSSRLHLERSLAIKCPSILTHLAGCKKVQQVLATPGSPHLSRFLRDEKLASSVLRTFAPIYPLDTSDAGNEAQKFATEVDTASRYVLKPQREGGGNNIYRRAIPAFLEKLPKSHWPAYILMEMIEPPALKNAILRNGEIQQGGVIGELGVYGVCLWRNGDGQTDKGEVLENFQAGYLLRTKGDKSEEGGVAAGFGAMDSCCLIDI
ncbi:glutathione synthetase large chain [Lineolata rhizophorae]|uniref:Glutathione synthetase n=1 Tax=Lineolata rhizophorae TaxID=578093 RepID=A0A6A6NZP8_9PEZI|nr:glutathione synthetase large chain [Lineolata rhizophorae]